MSKIKSVSIDFSGLFLLAFVVLKLCKVINWSWWWVLCPLWIPLGLAILFAFIYLWLKGISERQNKKYLKERREASFKENQSGRNVLTNIKKVQNQDQNSKKMKINLVI